MPDTSYEIRIQAPEASEYTRTIHRARMVLGRSKAADLVIVDPRCSSRHCELRCDDGVIVVHDLGSTNGLFFDRQRREHFELLVGEHFHMGMTRVTLEAVHGAPAETTDVSGPPSWLVEMIDASPAEAPSTPEAMDIPEIVWLTEEDRSVSSQNVWAEEEAERTRTHTEDIQPARNRSRLMPSFIDLDGCVTLAPECFAPDPFRHGVSRVLMPGSFRPALIDRQGDTVHAPTYQWMSPICEGYAVVNDGANADAEGVLEGGRFGLIAANGETVIAPQFGALTDVHQGVCSARQDGRWGVIRPDGSWLVPPTHDGMTAFHEGFAVASTAGKSGYVNVEGLTVISATFDEAHPFHEGLARVRVAGKGWSAVNHAGQRLSVNWFEDVGRPHAGHAPVMRDDVWGVLDPEGRALAAQWFHAILPGGDGVWPVCRDGRWALLTSEGEVVGDFDRALTPTEGLAPAQDRGRWGFADRHGQWQIAAQYEDVVAFDGGVAAVKRDGLWTLIDPTGRERIPPRFERVNAFSEGRAAALSEGRWGYIDTQAAWAVPPRYDRAEPFSEGLAAVWDVDWIAPPKEIPSGRHLVPSLGLSDLTLQATEPEDEVVMVLGYGAPIDTSQVDLLHQLLDAWAHTAGHREGGPHVTPPWISDFNLYLRVHGLHQATNRLATLVEEVETIGVSIREMVATRWSTHPRTGAMAPTAAPSKGETRADFTSFDAYWHHVWERRATAPATERPYQMRYALPGEAGMAFEERGMPIHIPGIRVGYGLVDTQTPGTLRNRNMRSREVAEVITEAVADRLHRVWFKPGCPPWVPKPFDQHRSDCEVDRLKYEGRVGYMCAFAYRDLLHMYTPSRFRYRETELMEALRVVIERLELAPVLLWQRFSKPLPNEGSGAVQATHLAIQLWEAPDPID